MSAVGWCITFRTGSVYGLGGDVGWDAWAALSSCSPPARSRRASRGKAAYGKRARRWAGDGWAAGGRRQAGAGQRGSGIGCAESAAIPPRSSTSCAKADASVSHPRALLALSSLHREAAAASASASTSASGVSTVACLFPQAQPLAPLPARFLRPCVRPCVQHALCGCGLPAETGTTTHDHTLDPQILNPTERTVTRSLELDPLEHFPPVHWLAGGAPARRRATDYECMPCLRRGVRKESDSPTTTVPLACLGS